MTDRGNILIADDDETCLLSTADLLRQEGYTCACALDSSTAMELLEQEEFDLLIADLKMPGNEDLEFIRALPERGYGLPVILMTAYPTFHSAVQSIQLPVVAYLVKPFELDQLLAQVQTSIQNFRVFQAVVRSQQHLQDWQEALKELTPDPGSAPNLPPVPSVETFLQLSVQNILNALSDLGHLIQALNLSSIDQPVCHLLHCPRLNRLQGSLLETIEVLEKTKNSFKSKELGALRRKLESLFQEEFRRP